jgi:hypothetical protein
MAAALVEDLGAAPVDSLEVRWITPGPLETAMHEWFARFPTGTETREDAYLLQPRLRGLSVKLRDGSALDVKSFLGSPGLLGVPGYGRLESWRKWSFPYEPSRDGGALPGWVIVGKSRRSCWVPLVTGHGLTRAPWPAARAGCMIELAEVHLRDQVWWSVGLEATGSAGLLRLALEHGADLAFAQPLPSAVPLSLDNSRSYAQWLNQRPSPVAAGTGPSAQDPPGGPSAIPGCAWGAVTHRVRGRRAGAGHR